MKKALLILLSCCSFHLSAQHNSVAQARSFAKGTWLVGLQAAYARSGLVDVINNRVDHILIAQAYGGYFITNKLLIGLNSTRVREKAPQTFEQTAYAIGPMIRYQITRTRFSPFLVASYQIGRSTYSGELLVDGPTGQELIREFSGSPTIYSPSLGAGLSIAIVPSLRVDIALGWQDVVNTPNFRLYFDRSRYQSQVGLNYQFRRKH